MLARARAPAAPELAAKLEREPRGRTVSKLHRQQKRYPPAPTFFPDECARAHRIARLQREAGAPRQTCLACPSHGRSERIYKTKRLQRCYHYILFFCSFLLPPGQRVSVVFLLHGRSTPRAGIEREDGPQDIELEQRALESAACDSALIAAAD